MTMLQHAILVLLLPLLSAAVIALFLRKQGALASWISTGIAAAIAAISIILLVHGERFESSVEWLKFGDFSVRLGIKFDDLAALMLFIVGFVGFLIHLFSLGYMHDDAARARFFGGLSIFMFSMIGIVLADNLFMIFIFWELVGFSSWLLINHYHEKQSAADASKKAFIVNRVGDFGFLLGIIWCYYCLNTVNLTELKEAVDGGVLPCSKWIPLLLFCGAMGKSAQLPLQVWLPDAMEGPTPVSALIHAATMVAAGIYMLCRIQFLMVDEALTVIMWIGTVTAVYAALCAVVQRDIKKVLAYSTLSQLGYMVAAFGLGSQDLPIMNLIPGAAGGEGKLVISAMTAGAAAAMFHLTTHAFFKALMFLGSGSVIHGCHHEQDIFQMGGLRKKMPLTFITFTIGVFAITGMPFFAGFFSKDAILFLAMEKNTAVFAILAFTAILTSFYMFRLWKITFWGEARSESAAHAHESGLTMTVPLVVLAGLSIIGATGPLGIYPKLAGSVAAMIPEAEGSAHTTILLVSLFVMVVGAGSALLFYKSAATDTLEEKSSAIFGGLTWVKESFDRLYDYYVAKVQQRFAMLLNFLEQIFLAGLLIRGFAGFVGLVGFGARALYTGSVHTYVYWFLAGAAVLWAFAAGIF
jgi:NADH-quinone oxidoreductase subunit L